MQQPFDIYIGNVEYAVFPEGNDIYVIFKDGLEFVHIQKDTDLQWITLDPETETPLFDTSEEINQIGSAILAYVPEEEELDEGAEDGEFPELS